MGEILSTLWKTLLFHPFLNALLVLYALFGDNLGFAVIVLAVIVRIILIPSTRKQMEMTKKMTDMRPRLAEIQTKFKDNKELLAKEQMKLYKDVGYNPVGCLGSFIPQILVLAAMIGVIRTLTDGNFDGIYPVVKEFVFHGAEMKLNTQFFAWDLSDNYTSLAKAHGYVSFKALPYLALGIAVGVVQYFASKFTQMVQPATVKPVRTSKDEPMSQEEMQAQMAKSMTTIFPIMTAFFTISAPAVLGLYWLVQSFAMIVQFFAMDKERSMKLMDKILPGRQFGKSLAKIEARKVDAEKIEETPMKVEASMKIETSKDAEKKKAKKKSKKKRHKKR